MPKLSDVPEVSPAWKAFFSAIKAAAARLDAMEALEAPTVRQQSG